MLHRRREQVDIGDLLVPMHTREVDMGVVAQRNIIGPELVVELGAGLAQALPNEAQTDGTSAAGVRQVQGPYHAVLDQRTGGDLDAWLADESVGLRRRHVRIAEQRHPETAPPRR